MIRQKMKTVDLIFMGICIFILLIICILIGLHLSKNAKFVSTTKNYERSIAVWKMKSTSITTRDQHTVDEIEQKLYSVSDLGNKIADLQNAYQDVDLMSPSGIAQTQEIANQLRTCIADETKSVPWYQSNVLENKCAWKFESTYQFSALKLPILFTCKTKDDELLAYATGMYDALTDQISDLEYHTTKIGSTYITSDPNQN